MKSFIVVVALVVGSLFASSAEAHNGFNRGFNNGFNQGFNSRANFNGNGVTVVNQRRGFLGLRSSTTISAPGFFLQTR